MPFREGTPALCDRYRALANATEDAVGGSGSSCAAQFDNATTRRCSQWVFEAGQRSTLVNEVKAQRVECEGCPSARCCAAGRQACGTQPMEYGLAIICSGKN